MFIDNEFMPDHAFVEWLAEKKHALQHTGVKNQFRSVLKPGSLMIIPNRRLRTATHNPMKLLPLQQRLLLQRLSRSQFHEQPRPLPWVRMPAPVRLKFQLFIQSRPPLPPAFLHRHRRLEKVPPWTQQRPRRPPLRGLLRLFRNPDLFQLAVVDPYETATTPTTAPAPSASRTR